MAFKISQIDDNGTRILSTLVHEKAALIGSTADSTLRVEFPEAVSINIQQDDKRLFLSIAGAPIIFKGKEHTDKLEIRNSADFSCCDLQFHITCQIDQKITPRKKSYVATFASGMVWTLLVIMLAMPMILPYTVKAHVQGSRSALVDKCSRNLDLLRKELGDKKVDTYTPIQKDILLNLKEEVEQIIWTFRNAGEFMNQQQMVVLEKDISRYFDVAQLLDEAAAIKVDPLDATNIIKALMSAE